MPQMVMLPALGERLPVSICIVVVLPAPLGPSRPRTSPRRRVKSIARTAACAPKDRDSAAGADRRLGAGSMTGPSWARLFYPANIPKLSETLKI